MRRRFMTPSKNAFDINNYLTIEALEDNFSVAFYGNEIEYAIDGSEWVALNENSRTKPIKAGQKVSFKAILTPKELSGIGNFDIPQSCNLGGNVMSMLFGDNAKDIYDLTGYDYAFYGLFLRCSSIQKITEDFLPATKLADACYSNMFSGCTSLVNAPELPATTLANSCYNSMFYGCTNLNYIKMLATNISASRCLNEWVRGVASTGTFVKSKDAKWNKTGDSGVPTGWTVITDDQESGGG